MDSIHFLWELSYNNAGYWPSVSFVEYRDIMLDKVDFAKSTSLFDSKLHIYIFFSFEILLFIFAL